MTILNMNSETVNKSIVAGVVIGTSILNPLIIPTLAITQLAYNKIFFQNNKSSLFGINRTDTIVQKVGSSIIKTNFIKDKASFFKVEMVNLLLDMEKGKNYKTTSQGIVLKELKKMEAQGYITNLSKQTKIPKSKLENTLNNIIVNIGMSNYSNLLKGSKKYDISFQRTDKEITPEFLEESNLQNHKAIYKNKELKKINYQEEKSPSINRKINIGALTKVIPSFKLNRKEPKPQSTIDGINYNSLKEGFNFNTKPGKTADESKSI